MTPDEIAANYFKHLQRADLLIEVSRWREALRELDRHLANYSDDYHALCQSALCRYQLKEFQAAYDLTKKGIEAAPEEEWAYRLQSLVFSANGEANRALEAAEKCVERAPNSAPALQTLVYAQAGYGDHENAEKTLEALLKISPDSLDSHEAAGFLRLRQERFDDAEKHFLTALSIDANSVNVLNNLGVLYLTLAEQGRGREYRSRSVEMFERALKAEPVFELGQENIKLAKTKTHLISPASIWAFVFFLASVPIYTILHATFSEQSPGASVLEILSPFSPEVFLLSLNILFIFCVIVGLSAAITVFFLDDRIAVLELLSKATFWARFLIGISVFIFLYLIAFALSAYEVTVFSGLAFKALVILLFGSILRIVLIRSMNSTQ